jgi:Cu2+-exporting ATPase
MDHSHDHSHDQNSHNQEVEQPMVGGSGHEHEHVVDHEPHDHGQHDAARHAGHDDHTGHVDHSGHEFMFRRKFWVSLILSVPVILYSEAVQDWFNFGMPVFAFSEWLVPLFSIIVFVYGGWPFIEMAIPEFKSRKPGMMALISLAISVAFIYSLATTIFSLGESFYWELVTLIVIMLLGHWLEMRSVRQASGALDELAKLMPDTAERLLPDGSTQTVKLAQLIPGDKVLVRPGASVPADGEVVEGSSEVNEAMITGESRPVNKEPGARVIGGTINGDGSLRVQIIATGKDSAIAGIMRLVEQAQQSKSRTQLLADRAAGLLFYTALLAAALTGLLWFLAIGWDIEILKRVVTVLVIACPHALGLAIPLVVAISTSLGARNGILVRDRLALEAARNLDVIVFDKTGTLTEGKFGVVAMKIVPDWMEEKALALMAALEGDSEHPIARGLREHAMDKRLELPPITNFETIKGHGVQAVADGQPVHAGGPRMLEKLDTGLPDTLEAFTQQSERKGHTVVYLFSQRKPVAAFALADLIRDEAKTVVQRLNHFGIQVVMLTGDSQAVARTVAEELGIERFCAEVLPEDKDKKIIELQKEGKLVAMVGDGVNDAPALTRADVGIAIGSGTDVAVESAGLILVKSNPMDVVNIVTLSKATYAKMIQNLIWATGYNVIALPLAAGVLAPWGILLSPAVGALLMSLSTVIVALNAQLLRRIEFSH